MPIAIRKNSRTCTKFSLYLIPKNIQETLGVPEWKEAVFEEMEASEKNSTWEKTDLLRGKIPIGCKQCFYNRTGHQTGLATSQRFKPV